jgi:hypothetical protein
MVDVVADIVWTPFDWFFDKSKIDVIAGGIESILVKIVVTFKDTLFKLANLGFRGISTLFSKLFSLLALIFINLGKGLWTLTKLLWIPVRIIGATIAGLLYKFLLLPAGKFVAN